jgi:hypothetical protein
MIPPVYSMLLLLFVCLAFLSPASAFSSPRFTAQKSKTTTTTSTTSLYDRRGVTTMEPPTREEVERRRSYSDEELKDDRDYPDMEYLIDSQESREMEDPFHILLLGSTFEKPKVTVVYVAGALEYVLDMPFGEGQELSKFAKDQGMSCLGTWPREECLSLGKQLQTRDIVCRVVPYCEGGQRGWQAKDASGSAASSSNSDGASLGR